MSFFTLLAAIARKQMSTTTPPPRTKAPLRLSQGSAVEISVVPLVLAEAAGALFDHDLAERHTIIGVGRYALFGIDVTRTYLSQNDGAYLHFASKGAELVETRLYRPYSEQIPATVDEWSFWLAEADGYIGYPIMQSKDEDGPKQYQRSWSASDARIAPALVTEVIADLTGNNDSNSPSDDALQSCPGRHPGRASVGLRGGDRRWHEYKYVAWDRHHAI